MTVAMAIHGLEPEELMTVVETAKQNRGMGRIMWNAGVPTCNTKRSVKSEKKELLREVRQ